MVCFLEPEKLFDFDPLEGLCEHLRELLHGMDYTNLRVIYLEEQLICPECGKRFVTNYKETWEEAP